VRLLLDTHIWIWSLNDPARLGKRTLLELRNPANELWLSAISTWEALTLHEKKRVRLHGDLDEWVAQATAPFREAPLTHEIAAAARSGGSLSGRYRPGAGFDLSYGRRQSVGAGRDCDIGESVATHFRAG